jgi:asparagine synthase (glutamine-hydrolysing)
MILGSYSIVPGYGAFLLQELVQKLSYPGLEFCEIRIPGFEGGYFNNAVFRRDPDSVFFFDESKDIAAVLDGNIYNSGDFLTDGQAKLPQLLARLFLEYGTAFAERLNGDFSICIIRPSTNEIYLFRDQIGISPLAWIRENSRLIFSSDIAGLCRAMYGQEPPDPDFLMSYFKYTDNRKTASQRVKRLLPGHFLCFSEKGIRESVYWNPELIKTDHTLSFEKMIADLKFLVGDSVRIRCDRKYTAGAHFSGGLDSGIVAALARLEYKAQPCFYGISWSPEGFDPGSVRYDERELVKSSAAKTGITPLFAALDEESFHASVASFFENRGYFSEHCAADTARSHGVNIVFSGWGGDEFISSGDRGLDIDLLKKLKLGMFLRRNPPKNIKTFIRNVIFYIVCPSLGILDRATAKAFRAEARYLSKPFKKSDSLALRNFYFHSSRRQMHLRMLDFYHLQERCESWITNGFRKGIEYRFPLLDKRIVEYMLKVPSELLCYDTQPRPLLREIGKGILPEDLRLNRYKDDPVYWACMKKLFSASSSSFMSEIPGWKTNPDMKFVDFKKLENDSLTAEKTADSEYNDLLFRSLVYLKGINEFSKRYRN